MIFFFFFFFFCLSFTKVSSKLNVPVLYSALLFISFFFSFFWQVCHSVRQSHRGDRRVVSKFPRVFCNFFSYFWYSRWRAAIFDIWFFAQFKRISLSRARFFYRRPVLNANKGLFESTRRTTASHRVIRIIILLHGHCKFLSCLQDSA